MISDETTLCILHEFCILKERNKEDLISVKDYLILKLEN